MCTDADFPSFQTHKNTKQEKGFFLLLFPLFAPFIMRQTGFGLIIITGGVAPFLFLTPVFNELGRYFYFACYRRWANSETEGGGAGEETFHVASGDCFKGLTRRSITISIPV